MKINDEFKAPEGVYSVRFGGFSTRDEASGGPVAKATDWGMRVYMRMVITAGQFENEEIPCSADLQQGLAGWCFVFSGLPPQSTELSEIEKQMKTDKAVSVRVNDTGWVQGVFVPKATYLGKFAGFTKRDENGKPVITASTFKDEPIQKVYWNFEIAAGELTGARVPASCRYAVKRRGDDLELTSRSSMYGWLAACGVDFANTPQFGDLDNTLPEFEETMLRANVLLTIQVGDSGWVEGGPQAIGPAPAGVTVAPQPAPAAQPKAAPALSRPAAAKSSAAPAASTATAAPPATNGHNPLEGLMEAIQKKCQELKLGVAVEKGVLTDVGKKFAAEHIAPVCVQKGIPRAFAKMTPDQLKELTGVVQAVKNDEF